MTITSNPTDRRAVTDAELHPLLAERWSPRAFNADREVDHAALEAVLEAARWAPSAGNQQPWRLVVARRGTELHAAIVDALLHSNRLWAPAADVLVVGMARTTVDGRDNPIALYDLGTAIAHLSVQACAEGLVTHQMGGFDRLRVADAVALGAEYEPVVVVSLGHLGDSERLPADLRQREQAPRTRQPLDRLVLRAA